MSRHSVQNTGRNEHLCCQKGVLDLAVGGQNILFLPLSFISFAKKVTRRLLFYFWVLLISKNCTVFENYSKCRISIFQFWDFPSIFVQLKLTANFSFSKNHQMRLLLWFSNTVRVCLFTAGVLQHFVTFSGIATASFRDLIIISKMSSAPHYSCFCE